MAFFILEVQDMDKARAFLDPAKLAKAKLEAGASDFEWHFIKSVMVG